MKCYVCRNYYVINWSSKLSSINENWKCWIIFSETGIKFYENISAELELLEFPIADGRTYTFWHTRNAEGADTRHVKLQEQTLNTNAARADTKHER
jgi:hypothetical protein